MLVTLCICIVLEIIFVCIIFKVRKEMQMKKYSDKKCEGKIVEYIEIPGRPNGYMIGVEYVLKGEKRHGKIYTMDKKAKKFSKEEKIPMIGIENSTQIFWEEESDIGRIMLIIIIGMGAVLLLVIIFCLSGGLIFGQ